MTVLERTPALPGTAGPVLTTERLVLRQPLLSDAGAIAAVINDRRIAENTARIPHPYTLADAEQFIAYVQAGSRELALLIALPDDTLIGGCGIGRLRGDTPEIGYWLGVPYWGRGYASEAAAAVLDHAFAGLGYDVLHAGARVTNPASRRVLEKCGYEWTGVVLQRVRALGTSVPVDRFRLTRERWASLQERTPALQVA